MSAERTRINTDTASVSSAPLRVVSAFIRVPLQQRRSVIILWALILLYIVDLGALSLLQHAAFETAAADLGNMNQAAWYTLHKGYPADSYDGHALTRFGGHVEPIFYLLAIPYALYQGAELLLVLQTVVVALGAVAAYMLGRDVLESANAGLAFAVVYLLFPSLQAANLTEFHPVALAAPFFLFAWYYLQKGSYVPFLAWLLLAMSTKEDMSLLAIMLGLAAIVQEARKGAGQRWPAEMQRGQGMAVGLAAAAGGLAWFVICVYVIIPHFSMSGDMVLFERYAEVGGSPQGLLRTALSDPVSVLGRLLAPEKLGYLAGLLASAGFLTLAAPWAIVLVAPSLGINMLSNYSPMFSGLSHYSAPVVPFIVIGAVYGARFLSALLQRRLHLGRKASLALVLGWLLTAALIYQFQVGFSLLSPLHRAPVVTGHQRLLARFTSQIPAGAIVSAQPPLHPHISSRALAYPFPVVNDASYVLLDVTARPTMHPNDLKNAVLDLIGKEGFGIVDAADGYILLRRGEAQTDLPDAFFSAFRTDSPRPQYQVEVDFGPGLHLLGYDVESVDEGRQRWMRTRLYWLVKSDLPADLRIWPFVLDQSGQVIEDTTQRPLAATLWYPPERWQQGEVIRMETLPWPLGNEFRLAVGALRGTDWSNRGSRLPAQLVQTSAPVRRLDEGTAVEIGHLRWARLFGFWRLEQEKPASPAPQVRLDARFGNQIKLLGYDLAQGQAPLAPGQAVAITLYWQALARPSQDYHTFAHVYDNAGKVAAQSDGVTGDDQPSSWWFPAQVYTETRTITLPAVIPDAPSVSIGLYLLETQERLPVVGRDGKAQGDTVKISLR